ncbi:MAG TPA: ABC transporter substrate binding protein, partial [Hyphomicrobiaceae bacterium]|nr:ABC transporter substrate binding protein [Hyphomicrobiaceae bacterium]
MAARTQERVRRVAVIMVQREGDPIGHGRLDAFLRGFEKLGWRNGQNVRIDIAWAAGDNDRMQQLALQFVAAKPDVIVVAGTPAVRALQRATSSIPVVFV